MENKCIFCNQEELILENELTWARYDKYPVSPGHLLIITKRHVEDFFATTIEERRALNNLLQEAKKMLEREYSPDGYNIGVNCGEAAGQTHELQLINKSFSALYFCLDAAFF